MDDGSQKDEMAQRPAVSEVSKGVRAVLVGVLGLTVLAAGVYWGRVLYYEQGLRRYAVELIARANQEDLLPVPAEGPEGEAEVDVTCSFEHLVIGEPLGKIRLTVKPLPHARIQQEFTIAYICSYQNGRWKDVESYHEH